MAKENEVSRDLYLVGVDVGGTFTDVVCFELDSGRISLVKTPSTPDEFARGVLNGLDESGISAGSIRAFVHGTTVATNAVIQRRGVPVALITTRGFRDVLEIRRTTRGELYNIQWDPPEPLVPRTLRLEVDERTDARGRIVLPVDCKQAEDLLVPLVEKGDIKSVAISFINSYANPDNEATLKRHLEQRFPGLFVVASSEVLSSWREFERTSTACVGAYVGPILQSYLEALCKGLKEKGYRKGVFVMLSNGGVTPANNVARTAPQTILSGPVAGAVAARELSRQAGYGDVIAIDIGGTSTDVSIIRGGQCYMASELEIEFGTIVSLPVIDISTIGAGGGSVAWIDKGGILRVGPRSAGALPGPACYGRGGAEPTITDANVVLGKLHPEYLLGGRLRISRELAIKAIDEKIARPLGLDLFRAAQGIVDVANNNIANAIRRKTVQRGLDPREFVLFAFGGAGPVHAAEVAEILEIPKVIVPLYPGVTSALGLVLADLRHDYVTSYVVSTADIGANELEAAFATIEERARRDIEGLGFSVGELRLERSVDARYIGQTHELTVELGASDMKIDELRIEEFKKRFRERHLAEFGHAKDLSYPVELVNLRVAATISFDKPRFSELERGKPEGAPVGNRDVYLGAARGLVSVPVFSRSLLAPGQVIRGPAVIEQYDSTIFVMPSQRCQIDRFGNLIIERMSVAES